MTMNTREREVMDALRLRFTSGNGVPVERAHITRAEFDALLAEGSASSEGAEAVAPFAYVYEWDWELGGIHRSLRAAPWNGRKPDRIIAVYTHPQPAQGEGAEAVDSAFNRPMFGRMIEADFEQSTATFEMEPGYYAAAGRFEIRRPQPAQGEQCSALEVFRIAGGDVECTPNPTAAVAMDCLRDLRWCYDEELSKPERRPIADEDALRFLHALCAVRSARGRWVTNAVCENQIGDATDALNEAFPRGLPAMSDAKVCERCDGSRVVTNCFDEIPCPVCATAEQPSCGQDDSLTLDSSSSLVDARDSERVTSAVNMLDDCVRNIETELVGATGNRNADRRRTLRRRMANYRFALDAVKAIAAQQRQGGEKKHDGPCWRNSHSDCGC